MGTRTRRSKRPRLRARHKTRAADPRGSGDLTEILRDLVSDDPQGGRLYLVQWRDRASAIFRDALATCGIAATSAQIDAYAHLCAAGRWNRELYGSRGTSRTYPARWLCPGLGLGLRSAFLPRNQDALGFMLADRAPMCVIDRASGAAMSPAVSYGLIWLPPVDLVDHELTGQAYTWADGSGTLDPHPSIMAVIE
jgi:hypothetical protein